MLTAIIIPTLQEVDNIVPLVEQIEQTRVTFCDILFGDSTRLFIALRQRSRRIQNCFRNYRPRTKDSARSRSPDCVSRSRTRNVENVVSSGVSFCSRLVASSWETNDRAQERTPASGCAGN